LCGLRSTDRDPSRQVEFNLVGSADAILEKVERLRAIGVDHCCALMIPADSISEMLEQMRWFSETAVMARVKP
jgi:hypothetical protein